MLIPKPASKRQSNRMLSDDQKAILLAAMNSKEALDQPPRGVNPYAIEPRKVSLLVAYDVPGSR